MWMLVSAAACYVIAAIVAAAAGLRPNLTRSERTFYYLLSIGVFILGAFLVVYWFLI